jgi:hypothetical protein
MRRALAPSRSETRLMGPQPAAPTTVQGMCSAHARTAFTQIRRRGIAGKSHTRRHTEQLRSVHLRRQHFWKLADYLLGLPRTMTQNVPINLSNSSWYTALFVEDDYRIHPRLTLNLGFQYNLQQPYKDLQNRMLTFVLGVSSRIATSAPTGILFPGDPGVRPSYRRSR